MFVTANRCDSSDKLLKTLSHRRSLLSFIAPLREIAMNEQGERTAKMKMDKKLKIKIREWIE